MFQFAFAPNSNRPVEERTNALPSSKRLATLALPEISATNGSARTASSLPPTKTA